MIQLTFDKISRFDRENEPASIAIPFSEGVLQADKKWIVYDDVYDYETQGKVTATWPDGSVKWLHLTFMCDLKGNEETILYADTERPNGRVRKPLWGSKKIPSSDSNLTEATVEPFRLPIDGMTHYVTDCWGKRINLWDDFSEYKVVESGPIKRRLWKSLTFTLGESPLEVEVILHQYAYKNWIMVEHRIINSNDTAVFFESSGIEIGLDALYEVSADNDKQEAQDAQDTRDAGIRKAYATSNYLSHIVEEDKPDYVLDKVIDADYLLYDANEHVVETYYGTFWGAGIHENGKGLGVTLYQAYQNFPKGVRVTDNTLEAQLFPKVGEPYCVHEGVAKTHRLFIHTHEEATVEGINQLSTQLQYGDSCHIDTSIYASAGVFEPIYPRRHDPVIEQSFLNLCDKRSRGFGIFHFGDAPDMGYTTQGRGGGKPVWTNNEYDFPHGAMLLYTNTGERRIRDYVLRSGEHLMDVDVCHAPGLGERYKGQIEHGAEHIGGNVIPCHQWAEGILDYYHLTGDERGFETAIGIGENILGLLQKDRYQHSGGINARETGWAMRSLLALYRETYEERWLEPCGRIIDQFIEWKEKYGGWLSPYTDHTVIRVPFMIAVAIGSLMRYYRVRPEERVKKLILEAADDLLDNCRMPDGHFYYKELPSLMRPSNNRLVLEALGAAYELSGRVEYLKGGLVNFHSFDARGGWGGKKVKEDPFTVIQQGPGPKGFAQSYLPLAYYYTCCMEEGLLD